LLSDRPHQYTYDVLGRQTSDMVTQLGKGVDGSVRRIDTAYDGQGNPFLFTSYADTAGTTVVNQVEDVFNGLGQLTGEYQSHSGAVVPGTTPEVQYQYNEMSNGANKNNSRLESMTYPNGRVLNYNYNAGLDDPISRLNSLSDSSGVLESYTYLGLNTVVERAHPQTGVNLTYISPTGSTGAAGDQYTGPDRFGRIADQLWLNTNTGKTTDEFQYSYDRDSNALTRSNLVDAVFSEQYSYDGFNQLTSFSRNNGHSQSWKLDALGNWTSVTTDGSTQKRTANAQNQYTSVSSGATPTYDNNGNLTTDPTNGNTYVYDAWNRLVGVKNGGNTLTSNTYDALNRRITESASGTQRDLYYNGQWQVIEERVNGQTQTQYVWDPLAMDTLVERDSNPDSNGNLTLRLYAQQDANGNVTALVDTSGNVVERFVYDPYGQVTVLAPNWSGPVSDAYGWVYLFQGGRYEATSGLYDFRNRDYSPTLGRWLQQDPIGYTGGTMNLYQMEEDNPVNRTDPSGGIAYPWSRVLSYKHSCGGQTWNVAIKMSIEGCTRSQEDQLLSLICPTYIAATVAWMEVRNLQKNPSNKPARDAVNRWFAAGNGAVTPKQLKRITGVLADVKSGLENNGIHFYCGGCHCEGNNAYVGQFGGKAFWPGPLGPIPRRTSTFALLSGIRVGTGKSTQSTTS
jgi:RHS repeat-associated protein